MCKCLIRRSDCYEDLKNNKINVFDNLYSLHLIVINITVDPIIFSRDNAESRE